MTNRPLSRTDPLGRTVRSAYDEAGRPTEVVRPNGRRMTIVYDEAGLPVRVTGADGLTVRQSFDERGNRTSVTDPSGARTEFTYDEAGHLAAVTDGLGHTTRIRCDRAGLPLGITDPMGAVTRYARDAFGRPVTITDPLGATTRLAWTVEGRLARRTAPDGSEESWTYDGEGNCTSHTDPLGAVSRFEYTDFDLLTARTGPDGVRYTFEHDADLRLTKVVNPQGLEWSYAYDPAGRLITETDFDGRTLGYAYDAAGRLAARTNGLGETIRFERNELGQAVRKDVEGAVTTFAYDIFDQLAQASGPDATLMLLRDRHGRVRSETVNGRELSYSYDELGRRNGRTTPGGSASAWRYDAAGNRTELTTSGRTVAFAHDAAGRELTRRFGETITLAHAFDPLGRLTDLAVTGAQGESIQRRAYHYRADGNLTGVDDQLSGSRRFDLDAAGRVTAVRAGDWSERYAYDTAGNQTEASWPAAHPGQEALGPRAYTGTRITRAGSVRYEHDAQGRVTLRQKQRLSRKPDTWRYTWDPEDRLTSVVTPRRHGLALPLRPAGPPHRQGADGGGGGRGAGVVHMGRHDAVRTDDVVVRIRRGGLPHLGPRGPAPHRPDRTNIDGARATGLDRRTLLRNSHRPDRHPERTDRRTGRNSLAHPLNPVGHNDVEHGRPRLHPTPLPGSVLRP